MDCAISILKLKQTQRFLDDFIAKLSDSHDAYKRLKQDHQQYRARVNALEAEVDGLRLSLDHSNGLYNDSATKLREQSALVDELKEAVHQYEGQESKHARERADYEDCIEQLETELKYALEWRKDRVDHVEENQRLRKTIKRMDSEVDELKTTMNIFSTGESGQSITAITMGRALGPELMANMDWETAGDFEDRNPPSPIARTMTITKGDNYAKSKQPKLMRGSPRRQFTAKEAIDSQSPLDVLSHPPSMTNYKWPGSIHTSKVTAGAAVPLHTVSSTALRLDYIRPLPPIPSSSTPATYQLSSTHSGPHVNKWLIQSEGEVERARNVGPQPSKDANHSSAPGEIGYGVHSPDDDDSSTSTEWHSETWHAPANAYWDSRRYIPVDNEDRYNFRKTLHERRLKLAPSASSMAVSFDCTYRFSGDNDLLSDHEDSNC